MLPEWPQFPEVYVLSGCPEGVVCTDTHDHERIVNWILQVYRIYEKAAGCENVKFEKLPNMAPLPAKDPQPLPEPEVI